MPPVKTGGGGGDDGDGGDDHHLPPLLPLITSLVIALLSLTLDTESNKRSPLAIVLIAVPPFKTY